MEKDLIGKVILVTGGTRGIGKAIAILAAERGANVVITYRDPAKLRRATAVQKTLEGLGAQVLLQQFDIIDSSQRAIALQEITAKFGRLDALILNAAGGLETDKGQDYAMLVNRDANVALINECAKAKLFSNEAWVIYLTSNWAHLYGKEPTPDFYLPVASTKFAAEEALRAMIPQLKQKNIGLGVVVAPVVSATGAFMVMKSRFKDWQSQASEEAIISPETVAEGVLSYLGGQFDSGHTVYL